MFIKYPSIMIVEQVHIIFDMNKLRMTDADMWGVPEGWGLCVCVCVCGGRGVLGVKLKAVQGRATEFITGTTELPAAPAR